MLDFVKAAILPPGLNIIIFILGALFFWRKFKKIGISLIVLACVTLYAFTTPLIAELLVLPLSKDFPALHLQSLTESENAGAIVVLSSGRIPAPEYNGMTVSPTTLVRLRYAARLARVTKLPILVSGGTDYQGREAEAVLMQQVLEKDFLVPVRWAELRSQNTYENAKYCARILHNHGIKTIFLVTNAWHMRRAVYSFNLFHIHVIPAPTGYSQYFIGSNFSRILPDVAALRLSRIALHEYIGLLWYKFAYSEVN